MKRGQFSMEFIIIFSLVFILFLLLAGLVVKFSQDRIMQDKEEKMMLVASSISDKIGLAEKSGTGYSAQLIVPADVDGMSYLINVIDGDLLVIYNSDYRVEKKISNITGTVTQGCNMITKADGVIRVASC